MGRGCFFPQKRETFAGKVLAECEIGVNTQWKLICTNPKHIGKFVANLNALWQCKSFRPERITTSTDALCHGFEHDVPWKAIAVSHVTCRDHDHVMKLKFTTIEFLCPSGVRVQNSDPVHLVASFDVCHC